MRICVISTEGDGEWFAWLLNQNGHEVEFSLKETKYAGTIFYPSEFPSASPKDYDLIVFDFTGHGSLADELRKDTPVIGDSELADCLEQDRVFGIQFMERCGIKVPAWEQFDDAGKAIRFIRKTKKRYVFKPCGKNLDKASTYVSKSPEDMEEYIDILFNKIPCDIFILQEIVHGTEISTEMWMNDSGYYAVNHDLEEKKFMPGGLGPNTGCSGSTIWMPQNENNIFQRGLKKTFAPLREMGYVGVVDLNVIATYGELFGIEWTPRFGYESTSNLIKLLPIEFGKFLYAIAANEAVPDLSPSHSFSSTILLSIPPYPANIPISKGVYPKGIPIKGLTESMLINFSYDDIDKDDDGKIITSGTGGIIGSPIGVGETIGQSFHEVKEFIDRLQVPDLQWRNDVPECIARRYNQLNQEGWFKRA